MGFLTILRCQRQRSSPPSTSSFRKKELLWVWQSRFPRSRNEECSFLTEISYHYYVFVIILELAKCSTFVENYMIVFSVRRDGQICLIRMTALVAIKTLQTACFCAFQLSHLDELSFAQKFHRFWSGRGLQIWICVKIVLCKKEPLKLISFVSVCPPYKFCASAIAQLEKILIACVSEGRDFSLDLSAALQKM